MIRVIVEVPEDMATDIRGATAIVESAMNRVYQHKKWYTRVKAFERVAPKLGVQPRQAVELRRLARLIQEVAKELETTT